MVALIGSQSTPASYLLTDTNLLNLVHWYSDEAHNLIQLTVVAVNEVRKTSKQHIIIPKHRLNQQKCGHGFCQHITPFWTPRRVRGLTSYIKITVVCPSVRLPVRYGRSAETI